MQCYKVLGLMLSDEILLSTRSIPIVEDLIFRNYHYIVPKADTLYILMSLHIVTCLMTQ